MYLLRVCLIDILCPMLSIYLRKVVVKGFLFMYFGAAVCETIIHCWDLKIFFKDGKNCCFSGLQTAASSPSAFFLLDGATLLSANHNRSLMRYRWKSYLICL